MLSPEKLLLLDKIIAETRGESPSDDDFQIAQVVAQKILIVVFGSEWQRRHIYSENPPTNFFRNTDTTDAASTLGGIRIIQLAEMVLNLQDVPGLAKSVEMIRHGDIEGGIAELEVGKLLFVNNHEFSFVVPRGSAGNDYDIEIDLQGLQVCGETKCKLESSQISLNGVKNALNRAREQLPADRPGIIFASIPHTWIAGNPSAAQLLKNAADKFLKGTGRIVSVKFHTSLVLDTGTSWAPQTLLLEIDNPTHRFGPRKQWTLFREMADLSAGWINLLDRCKEIAADLPLPHDFP